MNSIKQVNQASPTRTGKALETLRGVVASGCSARDGLPQQRSGRCGCQLLGRALYSKEKLPDRLCIDACTLSLHSWLDQEWRVGRARPAERYWFLGDGRACIITHGYAAGDPVAVTSDPKFTDFWGKFVCLAIRQWAEFRLGREDEQSVAHTHALILEYVPPRIVSWFHRELQRLAAEQADAAASACRPTPVRPIQDLPPAQNQLAYPNSVTRAELMRMIRNRPTWKPVAMFLDRLLMMQAMQTAEPPIWVKPNTGRPGAFVSASAVEDFRREVLTMLGAPATPSTARYWLENTLGIQVEGMPAEAAITTGVLVTSLAILSLGSSRLGYQPPSEIIHVIGGANRWTVAEPWAEVRMTMGRHRKLIVSKLGEPANDIVRWLPAQLPPGCKKGHVWAEKPTAAYEQEMDDASPEEWKDIREKWQKRELKAILAAQTGGQMDGAKAHRLAQTRVAAREHRWREDRQAGDT